jgi:hypothetical protein
MPGEAGGSYAWPVDPRFVRPIRNTDAPLVLESFLIAAVVSFLGIRAFLMLAGFPKVGNGELHIAHMLWGGALMLVALLLLLAFLDRPIQHVAAVVAGLGFGTFVDEIGKFVTADNDYFFRPAIALIYVVFVAVFIASRWLEGRRRLSEREAMANALALVGGSLGASLEPDDRAKIVGLLDQATDQPELGQALRRYLEGVPSTPEVDAPWERIPRWIAGHYDAMAAHPRFDAALTVAVIVYTAAAVVASVLVLAQADNAGASDSVGAAAVGQALSTLAGAVLVGRGVLALPGSRVEAYHWFLRGVLVWLLVTQVFVFYRSQLAGLGGLAIDLLAYMALRYALAHERGGRPAGDTARLRAG